MLWIRILTWLKGECVGQDSWGNRYYREKGSKTLKERRWVIYKGIPEASKIPPEWHGWIHHTREHPLPLEARKRWPWEKNHLPNLTGTPYAYFPLQQEKNKKNTPGSYEAWTPPKDKK